MSPIHMRMARAALGWSVRDLAARAGVTANTISRIETGADAKGSTLTAIRNALEAAGIEFTNGDGYGVRVPKRIAGRPVEDPPELPPVIAE